MSASDRTDRISRSIDAGEKPSSLTVWLDSKGVSCSEEQEQDRPAVDAEQGSLSSWLSQRSKSRVESPHKLRKDTRRYDGLETSASRIESMMATYPHPRASWDKGVDSELAQSFKTSYQRAEESVAWEEFTAQHPEASSQPAQSDKGASKPDDGEDGAAGDADAAKPDEGATDGASAAEAAEKADKEEASDIIQDATKAKLEDTPS